MRQIDHIHWYCKSCKEWYYPPPPNNHKALDSHANHLNYIVGIRGDIFMEGVWRMVQELDMQNRLLKLKGGKK